jgi:hypothetical protein
MEDNAFRKNIDLEFVHIYSFKFPYDTVFTFPILRFSVSLT